MEPEFKTSFMPKQPIAPQPQRALRGGSVSLMFLLTLIVFLVAVLASSGLFLYQQFLISSIERKSQDLESARASFEPALIQELTRLDARIETAESLLGSHVALSQLFVFLESNTVSSVQFNDFRFAALSDEGATITMNGKARNFGSVALQSDRFGDSSVIQEPIFSNLNVDAFGDVTFTVDAFINPRLLSYRASLNQRAPRGTVEQEPSDSSDAGAVETPLPSEASNATGL